MANMAYCRFENTYQDFQDCMDALQEEGVDALSEKEKKAAKWLYDLAKDFVEEYSEEFDEEADGE